VTRRVLVTGGSGFIGTNVVAHCLARGDGVVNLDPAVPRCADHRRLWEAVDLRDPVAVARVVADAAPTHVVHLGARTDLRGGHVDDYTANTTGTEVLLDALGAAPDLRRAVLASSMLVCRNGYRPVDDHDYCPTTAYGESKQRMEEIVRRWQPAGARWVLVRPTSIWGPWFAEPYRPFFETVRRGRYVHPGSTRIDKALGYVGNAVAQIDALLDDESGRLDGSTVYLCDHPPYSIGEWADAIARLAGSRRPPVVPVPVLRAAARVGDLLQRWGRVPAPPITSFRLDNMLTGSSFPTADLDALTGPLPFTMEAGVRATLAWLDEQVVTA
jgi:nucleoside-diphosphate-sugar epimerase